MVLWERLEQEVGLVDIRTLEEEKACFFVINVEDFGAGLSELRKTSRRGLSLSVQRRVAEGYASCGLQ